ncbi:hypothetical protein DPSP01_014115 [Paraphaeosphaeria sporulosa]|uniref:Uncharacterized protein n=1 Tax=Paraphaeosphaeria sporulosa TaxID=1460663 RepID=A0A177C5C8_9PLEO|nr:uncharacterized protein CC84DRAFT_973467 [Paraphaeosphaeria sporulosa]OAG01880.1 hypothetical protein CC84DRAFT_973467 [Paraphaeosphaeria sporulosa]
MEATAQEPYRDSPSSSRSSMLSCSRDQPAKPLPSLPLDTPTELLNDLEPYRDEPSAVSPTPVPVDTAPSPQRYHSPAERANARLRQAEIQVFYTPYTDAPRAPNDEDVPLAQLYPYPTEAPPPYQIAVRDAFRETLAHHMPRYSESTIRDEEAAMERAQSDDVRFTVEKAVATIIVVMLLLVIASILALIAVSGFNWKI